MQQVTATAHDPAPSRLSYRVQRWMLTPGIRLMVRLGGPMCVLALIAAAVFVSEARREAFAETLADIRASIQERPEFMVKLMVIEGAGEAVAENIREILPLEFPVSSFDLDTDVIRAAVMDLDPVKTVSIRIRPGGTLEIDVVERVPVMVWRNQNGVELLDETGVHVGILPRRTQRADLPLIVGDGADAHVDEALRLLAAASPIAPRVRGLQWVGDRRWDVVLDRGQRILLPSDAPIPALERVIALSEARDLLERDLAAVDMRIADRPTLRMTRIAMRDWWRIKDIDDGQ